MNLIDKDVDEKERERERWIVHSHAMDINMCQKFNDFKYI